MPTRSLGGDQRLPAGLHLAARPAVVSIAAVQGPPSAPASSSRSRVDLRVLAEDAQLSMQSRPRVGPRPDGHNQPLVERRGYARALEVCATARMVVADEAMARPHVLVPAAPWRERGVPGGRPDRGALDRARRGTRRSSGWSS